MYAIVRAGGRQEKVSVGDVIELDRQSGAAGDSFNLAAVLLVDDGNVTTDADVLAKVTVTAEVLEHTKGPKIDILKYKNKTGYKKRQGHRQQLTQARVTAIETGK